MVNFITVILICVVFASFQLEEKITAELSHLKAEIDTMEKVRNYNYNL